VLAGKGPSVGSGSFLRRLLRSLSPERDDMSIVSYRLTPAGSVVVHCRNRSVHRSAGGILLTLPLGEKAAIRLQHSVENRARLQPLLSEEIVTECTSGVFEKVVYTCEPCFEGMKVSESSEIEALSAGGAMLDRLLEVDHLKTNEFSPEMYFTPDVVNRFLDASFGENASEKSVVAELLRKTWKVRTGPYHGDFHLGNILRNEASGELRLIDWDLAGIEGLPLWDALNLWVHTRFENGEKWVDCFASTWDALAAGASSSWLSEHVKRHAFSREEVAVSLLTYPILQWRNKIESGDGKGEIITNGLSTLTPWLEFHS
jgi:hypothetical protein